MSSGIPPSAMAGAAGAGGAGGSVPTAGPPPAAGMQGVFAGATDGGAPGGGGDASAALKGITDMTMEVDQILQMLATTCGDSGGAEVSQARTLIKQGVAKFMGSLGTAGQGASSPTSPGTNFPGGGFTSGK